MKCNSGIYIFENVVKHRAYVGSASYLDSRRRTHLRALKSGTHYNTKFQNAWTKYGEENFVYRVVEYVEDKSLLRIREQYWMDALNAVSRGYNILPTAGSMFNFKLSEETKKKISAAHLGKTLSESQKLALRLANTGRKQSAEQVARHSKFMTGRKPSPEHLAAQIAGVRKPETRAKISLAGKGRVKSEQHMNNIRAALKRPEVVAKMKSRRPATLGRLMRKETRQTISQKAKERWSDPELRAKYVQARIDRALRDRFAEQISPAAPSMN